MIHTDTTNQPTQRSSMLCGSMPATLAKFEYPLTVEDRERPLLERYIANELKHSPDATRQAQLAAELEEIRSPWAPRVARSAPADLPTIGREIEHSVRQRHERVESYVDRAWRDIHRENDTRACAATHTMRRSHSRAPRRSHRHVAASLGKLAVGDPDGDGDPEPHDAVERRRTDGPADDLVVARLRQLARGGDR